MRIRSDETYWLLKNGLLTVHPSLQVNKQCDVLVVGGGITGALMAYQCGVDGYNVILIDKRDVAFGSTSASTSMLQYEIDEPLYSLKKKVGKKVAVDCYLEGVDAINKLETLVNDLSLNCGFDRKESLYLIRSSKDEKWMQEEFNARLEAGLQVQMLSKDAIREKYQAVCQGGILSSSGASIDAYSFTHQLLEVCKCKFGLQIYDHTELTGIQEHKATVTGGFEILFKSIIYATGYESQTQLPKKVAKLISTYALVSEPMPSLSEPLENTLFWDTGDPYFYMRATEDNRLLIGGVDENFKNPVKRDRLIERKEVELVERLGSIFPQLHIIPDFSWAGTFGVTRDSLPFIGPYPGKPDTYYALGFGGNGITFSVMGMEIISDAIAGRPNRFIEYFKFGR